MIKISILGLGDLSKGRLIPSHFFYLLLNINIRLIHFRILPLQYCTSQLTESKFLFLFCTRIFLLLLKRTLFDFDLIDQICHVLLICRTICCFSIPQKRLRTFRLTLSLMRKLFKWKIWFYIIQIFYFLRKFNFLQFYNLQLLGNNFSSFICLQIEPFEVQHNTTCIVFQILAHFFLSAQSQLVLIKFFYQLFLFLTGQVMDMTLYLFDSSCYLDLQIPIFRFQLQDFRLQIGYLSPVIYLLMIQLSNCSDLIQRFLNRLQLFLNMLVGGIEEERILKFSSLLLQAVNLLVQIKQKPFDGLIADWIVLLGYCSHRYLFNHLADQVS